MLTTASIRAISFSGMLYSDYVLGSVNRVIAEVYIDVIPISLMWKTQHKGWACTSMAV
ncbi:hypothetical protein VSAL_I2127 [Aliivibrio salmonicida LFI1238]|uniref:Uncharacterized protein n=1 Tax=Aliivibrio salmonicida (strain LFI1238) TaxID=316275 RepID=B6EI73_ALISL|nr:hypothetical protein VSAL_I2127 [Aliivibrio salmonicida LFI1238]